MKGGAGRSGGTVLDPETLGKSLLLASQFSVPSGLREVIFTPMETFHSLYLSLKQRKQRILVDSGLWGLKLIWGPL